jgi:small subunit ribosomal protein S20
VAYHKSAEKRARQTVKRTERNTAVKSRVKSAVKALNTAIVAADKAEIDKTFAHASRALRKAATQNILHKRTADRRVSRLAKAHHKATQAATA